jgi:lyso-ornithine lipid O-acyltransferase
MIVVGPWTQRRQAPKSVSPSSGSRRMPFFRVAAICIVIGGVVIFGLPWRWTRSKLGFEGESSLSLWFCRAMCRLLAIRIVERNPRRLEHPSLVISNHVSWTDVIVLGALHPLSFVAKKEVASWPVIGAFARAQGCVFIDRARRMRIPDGNREIADKLLNGKSVVLFAEATTGDGTIVRRFHSSHMASARDALIRNSKLNRIAMQPISIVYKIRQGLPLGRSGRSLIAWYGDQAFMPSLRELLMKGPIECEVAYGPPIDYLLDDNRKSITRQVETVVRRMVAESLTS